MTIFQGPSGDVGERGAPGSKGEKVSDLINESSDDVHYIGYGGYSW